MNNYRLYLIALVCLPTLAFSQRNTILKLDLHAPVFRTGIISVERVLDENSSIGIGLLYTDKSEVLTNADYLTRVAITPEYRYYLASYPAPRGYYAAVFGRFQYMETQEILYSEYDPLTGQWSSSEVENRSLATGGIGIGLGIQEVFKDRITVDLQVGTLWNSGDKRADLTGTDADEPNEVFKPYVGYFVRTSLSVGIMF